MANLLRKGDRTESAVTPSLSRSTPAINTVTNTRKSDHSTFNPWDIAQVWIQSISKEESTKKQWEQMYGWMADLDAKGNLKPRKRTVDNSTRFSNTLPTSRGHDYGWHLETEIGQKIKNLQTRFDNQHKKRLATEVLGYD